MSFHPHSPVCRRTLPTAVGDFIFCRSATSFDVGRAPGIQIELAVHQADNDSQRRARHRGGCLLKFGFDNANRKEIEWPEWRQSRARMLPADGVPPLIRTVPT